ncbi:hypothetical protein B0H19DRAFT_1076518 [Mycena capillaripes]|nr:hypothetical protein B0H19DRAFT_1076518 [Mycena capillaripes]
MTGTTQIFLENFISLWKVSQLIQTLISVYNYTSAFKTRHKNVRLEANTPPDGFMAVRLSSRPTEKKEGESKNKRNEGRGTRRKRDDEDKTADSPASPGSNEDATRTPDQNATGREEGKAKTKTKGKIRRYALQNVGSRGETKTKTSPRPIARFSTPTARHASRKEVSASLMGSSSPPSTSESESTVAAGCGSEGYEGASFSGSSIAVAGWASSRLSPLPAMLLSGSRWLSVRFSTGFSTPSFPSCLPVRLLPLPLPHTLSAPSPAPFPPTSSASAFSPSATCPPKAKTAPAAARYGGELEEGDAEGQDVDSVRGRGSEKRREKREEDEGVKERECEGGSNVGNASHDAVHSPNAALLLLQAAQCEECIRPTVRASDHRVTKLSLHATGCIEQTPAAVRRGTGCTQRLRSRSPQRTVLVVALYTSYTTLPWGEGAAEGCCDAKEKLIGLRSAQYGLVGVGTVVEGSQTRTGATMMREDQVVAQEREGRVHRARWDWEEKKLVRSTEEEEEPEED